MPEARLPRRWWSRRALVGSTAPEVRLPRLGAAAALVGSTASEVRAVSAAAP
jgi:hypothetical protein